jgi:hypothetical protein
VIVHKHIAMLDAKRRCVRIIDDGGHGAALSTLDLPHPTRPSSPTPLFIRNFTDSNWVGQSSVRTTLGCSSTQGAPA